MKSLKEKTSLTSVSLTLSAFTLFTYHAPFFRQVLDKIEGGFNGVLITVSLAILMLALNFFFYYLVNL